VSGLSTAVVRQIKDKAQAALENERSTRERVEHLERWAQAASETLFGRGFWGRLRWLVTGK